MTTIAVRRYNEMHAEQDVSRIVIGADTRATLSESLYLDGGNKLLTLATGETVAVAGTLSAIQAFELFLTESDFDCSSRIELYRSVLSLRQDMSVNQFCLTDKHTDAGDFAVFPLQMLVVNNDGKIFSVMNYGEVLEHEHYFALGTGCHYALGAMAAGAPVQMALQIAAQFDPGTNSSNETLEIEVPALADGETNYTYEDSSEDDNEDHLG